MHIPENYLSPSTCGVMGAVMIPIWYESIKKVKIQMKERKETIPLLGIASSLCFLVMMFNLPVPGGTTAHAVGAVLISLLLGPWAACLAVTITLILQAVLFGDGGILALGANCFNMAFVMPFVGYGIFQLCRRIFKKHGDAIGAAVGGYAGVCTAALCAAIELGIQPLLFKDAGGAPMYNPYPLSISIPAMLGAHVLVIGFVEAIFTVGVYKFILKVSPNLVYVNEMQHQETKEKRGKFGILYAALFVIALMTPLGLLATGDAWGEWDLSTLLSELSKSHLPAHAPSGMVHGFSFEALMSDYSIKGLPPVVGYILCALIAILLFMIIYKVVFQHRKDEQGE